MATTKSILSAHEAARLVKSGATVMIGGFMGCGNPHGIIDGMICHGITDITLIANDTGKPDYGIGKLLAAKRLKKIYGSHIGLNPETGRQINSGELEAELMPQGTLAERIRAAGSGLGGFLTPSGVGTMVEEGKQRLTVAGKDYLLELPLHADIALVKAKRADTAGNLIYNLSAQNFNPLMAMAAKLVIAEVEEIVEAGELDPNGIHTPSIFVDYLVLGAPTPRP